MLDSIRARLAAWHTLALALVLVGFSVAVYGFLYRMVHERTDRLLKETAETFHYAFAAEMHESRHPDEAAEEAAAEFRFSDRRVVVYDRRQRLLTASNPADVVPGLRIPHPESPAASAFHALLDAAGEGRPGFASLETAQGRMRVYATPVAVEAVPYTIVALQFHRTEVEVLGTFLQAVLVAVPLALLLAGLGGYVLARKSLAPVVAMGEQAERISAENLDERLAVPNLRDELGRLATVFNRMLERLEAAFAQQRQFMADASHELRTPVSIVRAEADVMLSRPDRPAAEYRESLEVMRKEADRLGRIIEDLFVLARADAGRQPLSVSSFYLEELLSDAVRAVRALARRRDIELAYTPDREAPCRGDEALLRRLVLNLLDNAIKYTPPGGRVTVTLDTEPGGYAVAVRDTGPGIPPEARDHVFDRFYRADTARERMEETTTSGAGLGLSIARWIAEAHGGTLELTDTGPEGTVFTFHLPAHV